MAEIDEVKELVRKLEPVIGSQAMKLWQLYLFSENRESRSANLQLIRVMADRHAQEGYKRLRHLPPPLIEALEGTYALGSVVYPTLSMQVGLRDSDMMKHVLIVGITGSGKTNTAFQLLRELARNGKPFLVFDWKRSYRVLSRVPELGELRVISVGKQGSEFSFNPLIPPPGTDPKHWLGLLIDVMSHAFFYGHGVEYFLREGIDELYRRYGNYEGSQTFPTFADLRGLVQKKYVRGREMLWMSSVKRVLAALTEPAVLAESLNVREDSCLADLLEGHVVLEMDDLPALEKTFLVEALLLWIYQFRKSQGRQEEFRHAIVLEEAHHVLSGAKESKLGEETIIESVVRMIREFGEGVIVVDQEPSKLSRSIVANTNTKLCFNLGNGNDVRVMSGAMALSAEEELAIDQLEVGEAIVKLKGRFFEPVRVRVPLVEVDSVESGGRRKENRR